MESLYVREEPSAQEVAHNSPLPFVPGPVPEQVADLPSDLASGSHSYENTEQSSERTPEQLLGSLGEAVLETKSEPGAKLFVEPTQEPYSVPDAEEEREDLPKSEKDLSGKRGPEPTLECGQDSATGARSEEAPVSDYPSAGSLEHESECVLVEPGDLNKEKTEGKTQGITPDSTSTLASEPVAESLPKLTQHINIPTEYGGEPTAEPTLENTPGITTEPFSDPRAGTSVRRTTEACNAFTRRTRFRSHSGAYTGV